MVVQHNMQAMNASRMLNVTTGQQSKTTEKLSSGYKINRAADDAAGLSISEKMRKQIRGLDQASTNAQDGVSAVQTAEGALTEVHSMLQRMNELAVQAANGTNSETDRTSIQDEINQLTTEIDRVAETTKFNESYLLKGGKGTQTNTLNGHDAGIKGTFVDGDKFASLSVDLSVGTSLTIGGQNFNIVNGGAADEAEDSLSKVQEDIKNISNSGAKVTINGTEYTASGSGKDLKFDAGTGTTYSAEEMSGMVKDGNTITISGVTKDVVDGAGAKTTVTDDSVNTESTIVRDYTSKNNITSDVAATKIAQALKQANDIGATTKQSKITPSKSEATVDKVANLSGNIKDGAKVTTTAKLLIYNDVDKTFTEVDGTGTAKDITEYAKDSHNTFYKVEAGDVNLKNNSGTYESETDLLAVHTKDAAQNGITKYAAGTALAALTGTGTGIVAGTTPTKQVKADANYALYSKTSLDEIGTFSNVTHGGKWENADMKVDFNAISTADDADTTLTKTKVAGQNALIDALENGKVSVNYSDAAGTVSEWSHAKFADSKLELTKDGKVSYDGVEIGTMKSLKTTTVAGTAVASSTATTKKDAEYAQIDGEPAGSTYNFKIEKGETQVANSFSLNLHVGADADMTNKISIGVNSMTSEALGIKGVNVSDDSGMSATYAIDAIEDAIKTVSAQRSALGAVQNRLEHTIANVDNVVENSTAAESRIRDTDMADAMVDFSKNNILAQAGQSMLAQANQSTQGVLSILG